MKVIIRYATCNHGQPYWITTLYNGTKIISHVTKCIQHKTLDIQHHEKV